MSRRSIRRQRRADEQRRRALSPVRILVMVLALPLTTAIIAVGTYFRATERDRPEAVLHLDAYPAHPLFSIADRLFSGGGFNIMRQAQALGDRHRAFPFSRRFDDQLARVAARDLTRCRSNQDDSASG